MANLSIDFHKIFPYVIDAFTKIYGEEYQDIIFQRINNTVIISYLDTEGLSNYIQCIKICKKREYAIKFLDKIGVNIEKFKRNNYVQSLDDTVENILDYYIGGSDYGFSNDTDYWAPLQAFKPSNAESAEKILENKLKIINFLLGEDDEQITEKNFDLFVGTEEYQRILEKIDELNKAYEQLLIEYRTWEKQLQPYEEFIESQNKTKLEILKKKKIATFNDVYSKLPIPVVDAISDKSLEEKSTAIFGNLDISSRSIIEAFSHDNMEKLKSKDVTFWDKYCILLLQSCYLKNMGIEIPEDKKLKCNSEDDINDYLNFLSQDNIKKHIPSDDLISYITSLRENNYEEALREYYMNREDFINAKSVFKDENNLEYIYNQIKNKIVCIVGQGGITNNNDFISIMFYTIRVYSCGFLFYIFMHECGHIIDQSFRGTGFEYYDEFSGKSEENPYDNNYRKYEKFNETLNDIFTTEAVELLHNQGIYLIEPQEFTSLDVNDINTTLITRNLLKPLVSKFRKQVISAKVNSDRDELTKYIGERNLEELVDVVNKVDYLSRNGLVQKIDSSPDDEMVKEYFEQVERAKKIYSNIDYYSNNIQNLVIIPDDESKKAK